VDYVTVDANATQTNVTGAKNWAAVKESDEYVIVKAILNPSNYQYQIPDGMITWSGGESISGKPSKRKVSKATSAKTRVTATCSSSDYVDIWILWASCTIRTSASKSPGNNVSFPASYGGDTLGALTDEDNGITIGEVVGKMEGVFTLSPSGVYAVVEDGWDIRRWIQYRDFSNGTSSGSDDRLDDDEDSDEDLDPDSDDKIYVTDWPTCGKYFTVNHTKETYNNFTEWLEWNGTLCSDEYEWYYRARIDDDLDAANKPRNDDTELNEVSTGSITIPSTAHYSTR
jgi:hypothetical protein